MFPKSWSKTKPNISANTTALSQRSKGSGAAFDRLQPSLLLPLLAAVAAIDSLGYTFNTMTLLGLLLLIGVVVDDAIVVVESVEHHIANHEDAQLPDAPEEGLQLLHDDQNSQR